MSYYLRLSDVVCLTVTFVRCCVSYYYVCPMLCVLILRLDITHKGHGFSVSGVAYIFLFFSFGCRVGPRDGEARAGAPETSQIKVLPPWQPTISFQGPTTKAPLSLASRGYLFVSHWPLLPLYTDTASSHPPAPNPV